MTAKKKLSMMNGVGDLCGFVGAQPDSAFASGALTKSVFLEIHRHPEWYTGTSYCPSTVTDFWKGPLRP